MQTGKVFTKIWIKRTRIALGVGGAAAVLDDNLLLNQAHLMTFSPKATCVCVCVHVWEERSRYSRAANEDRDIHDNYQLKLSEPQCSHGLTVSSHSRRFSFTRLAAQLEHGGCGRTEITSRAIVFASVLWIRGRHCEKWASAASRQTATN